jgi:hypothetical protein
MIRTKFRRLPSSEPPKWRIARNGGILMRLQKGQLWQCESRYCGSEFQVVASSEVECGINPRCSCGSMMKKIFVTPQVKASEEVTAVAPMERRKEASSTK